MWLINQWQTDHSVALFFNHVVDNILLWKLVTLKFPCFFNGGSIAVLQTFALLVRVCVKVLGFRFR